MSYDIDALAARIKGIPFAEWPKLADAAGVSRSLPRKVVYERVSKHGKPRNFGLMTVKPLFEYFAALDRKSGKRAKASA